MQETWVQFLGREDPLEKEMETYSSILSWRIPRKEEPCRLQSMGLQESDVTNRIPCILQDKWPFYFTSSPPLPLCSIKEIGIQIP